MREQWARRIAFITGLLVILLAVVFAYIQNPSIQLEQTASSQKTLADKQAKPTRLDADKIEAGKEVYKQQSCARCHSIAGKGNPRNPLDGIGDVYTAEELRDWITAGDTLRDELPEYLFKLKQRFRKLTDDEIDSLITYMQSLR
ncbi:MAG: c-type cytochrome [Gammaproteobacteria bacterium]|nr:c-type cytochrome [Gammaproteobacteria bacterium]